MAEWWEKDAVVSDKPKADGNWWASDPIEGEDKTAEPNIPWYQEAAQAADDILRLGSNAVTFGFRDKLAPYVTGRSIEEERAMTNEARARAGSAGLAAEFLGAAATPVAAAKTGMTVTRAIPSTLQGVKGLLARTGAMAGEGAVYGGAHALGNDTDITEGMLYGAAGGALGNVAGEGISKGISTIAGKFNKIPAVPERSALISARDAAYQAADDAGVIFKPKAVNRITTDVVKKLSEFGFDPANQPGAAAALRRLQELRKQNVTLKGLDTIRKVAQGGYNPMNKSNNQAISLIIESIDDAIAKAQPGDILSGNSAAGAKAISEARSLHSRIAKMDQIDDAINRADLRAASTGSGGNADNAARQNIRRVLEKPRGYTADEKKALEKVVRGTSGQNALRLVGKLSPSGNGLMAALGVGGAMVNPAVGALSLGGMGAKALADRTTQKNARELMKLIAAGGNQSAVTGPKNIVQLLAEQKREALARALMGISASRAAAP